MDALLHFGARTGRACENAGGRASARTYHARPEYGHEPARGQGRVEDGELNRIIRRGLLLAAISLVACALAACQSPRTEADAHVLRLNLGGEPQTLDPQRSTYSTIISVMSSLNEQLIRYGP